MDSVSLDSLLRTLEDLQAFGTRYTYSPKCDSAARAYGGRFTELGLTPEYDRYLAGAQHDTSWNVIATIPGTVHPESVVIACAHYDSYTDNPLVIAPGADDNGTGTVALIELARVLRETPFRWTIKLAAFSGEEQWMLGSGHWVDSVVMPQGMLIAGVYNLDMFCYTAYDSTRMYFITNLASRPLAVRAETANVRYGIGLNLINYRDDDCAGDNAPFWDHGIKAVFALEDSEWGIWNGSNPYYHTYQDSIARLRPGQLLRGTQVALGCPASLATPWPASGIVEKPAGGSSFIVHRSSLRVSPNPFVGFARIPGHETAHSGSTTPQDGRSLLTRAAAWARVLLPAYILSAAPRPLRRRFGSLSFGSSRLQDRTGLTRVSPVRMLVRPRRSSGPCPAASASAGQLPSGMLQSGVRCPA